MCKKLVAFLLCAMMLVSLVACGGGGNDTPATSTPGQSTTTPGTSTPGTSTPGTSTPGTSAPSTAVEFKEDVIIGTNQEFTTTDPQGSNSMAPLTLATLTHETLTSVDGVGNVSPGLATYEQVDALTYVFTIPDNVTFTNGDPCTTEDIAFTFERARESSFTSGKITTLDHTEIISPTQIKFVLNSPNQDFLTTLAHRGLGIMSKKACEADPAKGFEIGTGRYYLTQWVPGDVTALARYDGYRGEKGVAKTITFRHIAETSARIIALQNDEIDLALNLDSLDASTILADSSLELAKVQDVQCKYLAFNVNAAPFTDPKVRQAIAHAVNKDNVILGATNGEGLVHTSVVNKTQFGLDETLQDYAYDPALAKSMLAEAGYPNGIELTLTCYKGAPYETIAAVVQNDMAAAGITVKVNPVEPAAQKAMMKEGEHEMVVYAWTDAIGTDFTVRSLLYSTSGSNRCKIADPALDKMIDDALGETDIAKREQMYKDIQQYVHGLCPYIMLYTSYMYSAISAGTAGIVWNANGVHDFSLVSVPVA